jgi:hypothetical protein
MFIDVRGLRRELAAEQSVDPRATTLREQAEADTAIVLKRERNVRLRQGDAAKSLLAVPVFGGVGAQELASRRRVEESSFTVTVVPVARAAGCGMPTSPASTSMRHAWALSRERDVSETRDTDAMLASASPRKPSVALASRSLGVASFDVA